MIHLTHHAAYNGNEPVPAISIAFSGPELLKFRELLNRALNTAPEFGADWFQLTDKLDQFIASNKITKP